MAKSFSQSELSNTDIAFELLQTHGRPMNYRDLIGSILHTKDLPQNPEQISAVLTQINLDTRFAYAGSGEWGLKVWIPTRGSKRMPSITLMNKSVAYDDEVVDKRVLEDQEGLESRHRKYDPDNEEDPGESGSVLDDEDEDNDEDEGDDDENENENEEEGEDDGRRQDRW